MRALPEQEAGQPLLARGADHQVGVGLALGVEVLGDVLDVEDLGQLLDRGAAGGVLVQQRAHRVGDLAAAAVADGDVDGACRRRRGWRSAASLSRAGGRGRAAGRAPRPGGPASGRSAARSSTVPSMMPSSGASSASGPVEVVGREQPEGDDLDADLLAPASRCWILSAPAWWPSAVSSRRTPGPSAGCRRRSRPRASGHRCRVQAARRSVARRRRTPGSATPQTASSAQRSRPPYSRTRGHAARTPNARPPGAPGWRPPRAAGGAAAGPVTGAYARSMTRRRWLFGDQLGPHFLDDASQEVLLVESRRVFARRRFHRQKAHLVLSAMRHRAAELGEPVPLRDRRHLPRGPGRRRRSAGGRASRPRGPPCTWSHALCGERDIQRLPARGYATSRDDFGAWAAGRGRRRLLLEDFYRDSRRRLGLLDRGRRARSAAAGTSTTTTASRRRAGGSRSACPSRCWPVEDEIDAQVREDLDRWAARRGVAIVGERRAAALRGHPAPRRCAALDDFVEHRLPRFGRHEDADAWAATAGWPTRCSPPPINLGLLDPVEVAQAAEDAYRRRRRAARRRSRGSSGRSIGWRDYVWHLYWHLGEGYRARNELGAHERHPVVVPGPRRRSGTRPPASPARSTSVRESGWAHHIPRLMVLGNYALQQRLGPGRGDRLVPPQLRRRVRLGDGAQRRRHVPARRRRACWPPSRTSRAAPTSTTMTDHCGGCLLRPQGAGGRATPAR